MEERSPDVYEPASLNEIPVLWENSSKSAVVDIQIEEYVVLGCSCNIARADAVLEPANLHTLYSGVASVQ